jgi:hypothetical protein
MTGHRGRVPTRQICSLQFGKVDHRRISRFGETMQGNAIPFVFFTEYDDGVIPRITGYHLLQTSLRSLILRRTVGQ